MGSKEAVVVWGVLLILSLTFFWVPSAKAQVEGFTKGQLVQENKFGFPTWTAANYVINAAALSHRHLYILVEAENFNEQNILKLFYFVGRSVQSPR
jgi:hypothetical protein